MSFIFIILFNLIILINIDFINKKYKVYDYPDNNRKIHKKKISLSGGLIIFLNVFLIFFFHSFHNSQFEILIKYFFSNNINNLFLFLFFLTIIFVFGYFDDKFNITANKKIIFLLLFILFCINIDSNLVISKISFSFSKDLFYLQPYEIFFTILCFLLFINAFNMYDGINLQSGLYTIYIFIIFFLLTSNYFFLIVLIPLITFLYLNLTNKIFLGNSGSYLVGFLISYFIIKIFNNFNNITSDKIFLLMLMPGFDMLRLFIVRLVKKKNPFAPDNDHFHHLLSSNYNFIYAVIINFFLSIMPFILALFISSYISFLIFLIIYFSFLTFFKINDQKY